MAKQTLLIDDMDGSTENVETIQFAVGNQAYSIDLNEKNRDKLDKALAPFVEKATPVSARGANVRRQAVPAKQIREWAKAQPEEISSLIKSDRGAVPKKAIEAYNAEFGTKY
ncbi:histone-like nucleoid-structuring protein Lsr2 [Nesterenkonia alba]|uniref:histone-like nucleoid-structuring protein Lsr2 n=1 Tax=Nesterenkonia alba TaxID=515814 RepID=UPI0003B6F82B|nr:Lsr2 family protein [Nesterenkonia alba]